MPLMFIDENDGSISIPCMGRDVLQAAEMAQQSGGRLRLVVSNSMATSDSTVGCLVLGDWRSSEGETK